MLPAGTIRRGRCFDRDVLVGVDADLGGDLHRLAGDVLGIELGVLGQRQRGRIGVIAARADGDGRGRGQHVARAGQHQRRSCRRRSSSLRAGADSGRCASPWPARPQARISWSGYCSSLASSRSNSVNASAVAPAKPPITLPPASRRTFLALCFITVLPTDSPGRRRPPRPCCPCGRRRSVVPCQPGSHCPSTFNTPKGFDRI
jgi:hypothetical protein